MGETDVMIRVEGLGKKYSIHHEQSERYTALRDVVARQAKAAGRLLNPFTLAGQLRKAQRQVAQEHSASEEEFWALKDVSFEIRRGERVGIIGRNGAGKSTLLKILSRITEPTTGRVEIRGRVASLLEVGTGFHPELTGRENIYLNGAILGMTRREIRTKFDEIVHFAEVEKFLDTPVKRYSSGMYVRLAFAVAAHLEPEILVVDEVLAVGDASFQKKCLGKMNDVADKEGRAILFVSHQMGAIQHLCNRALILKDGRLINDSPSVAKAIKIYLQEKSRKNPIWEATSSSESKSNPYFHVTNLYLANSLLEPIENNILRKDECVYVCIKAKVLVLDESLTIGYDILTDLGDLIYRSFFTDEEMCYWPKISSPITELASPLPSFLNEGNYIIRITGGLHSREWIYSPNGISPEINFTINGGLSKSPYWQEQRPGLLAPTIRWKNH